VHTSSVAHPVHWAADVIYPGVKWPCYETHIRLLLRLMSCASSLTYVFVVCRRTIILFMLGCGVRAWLSSLLNIRLCGFIAVTKVWVIYASMHKVVV